LTNKARLKLLHRREEHLQDLFETARKELVGLAQDESRYEQFLAAIILQGSLALMEPEIIVVARPKDKSIVEKAIKDAQEQYKEISGREVKGSVDTSLDDELWVVLASVVFYEADMSLF
jgi:V-type H+-transporting ATPase subunit E